VAIPVTLTVTAARSPGPVTQTLSHLADGRRWKNVGQSMLNRDSARTFTLKSGIESGTVEALAGPTDSSRRSSIPFPWVIREPFPPRILQRSCGRLGRALAHGAIGGMQYCLHQIAGQPGPRERRPDPRTERGRRFLLPFAIHRASRPGVAAPIKARRSPPWCR